MKTFTPEEIDPSLPEVVKRFLASGKSLEEIKLHANGKWSHEGMDFENPKIVALFSRSVARTSGGTWVLDIPPFTYPIEVEDAPFFVEDITLDGSATPTLHLSNETEEALDPGTLRYEEGGRLYCDIRQGEFKARFKKKAYYKLLDEASLRPEDDTIVLELGAHTIELGEMAGEEA